MLNRLFREQDIHPGPPDPTTTATALPASGRLDYAVHAPVPGPKQPLWQVTVDLQDGTTAITIRDGEPVNLPLGRLQTPEELAGAPAAPETLLRRAERVFHGWGNAGPGKTRQWFEDLLRRYGYASGTHPDTVRLPATEAKAYGVPPELPTNPAQRKPIAVPIPRDLSDYDHNFALYRKNPDNIHCHGLNALTAARPPEAELRLPEADLRERFANDAAAMKSWLRHRRKDLRIQGCFNAGCRRLRELRVREQLEVHLHWGKIGPIKHPGVMHSHWYRKDLRDQARAALRNQEGPPAGQPAPREH